MDTTMNRRKLIIYLSSALVILIAFFSLYSILTGRRSAAEEVKWDGTSVATSFTSGNGTKENPYVISSGNELAYFKTLIEKENEYYKDKYYALGADINLDYKDFESIGDSTNKFSGYLDGKGYKISNLKLISKEENGTEYYSLITNMEEAEVKNINIIGIEIVPETENNMVISVLSNNIVKSNINNISINNSKFNLTKSSKKEENKISGFITEVDKDSTINNIYFHASLVSEYGDNIGRISYSTSGKMTNIYSYYESGLLLIDNIDSYITNTSEAVDNKLDKFDEKIIENFKDEDYEFVVDNENIIIKKKEEIIEENNNSTENNNIRGFGFTIVKSPAITLHDTGKSGNTIYINDLNSDFNYYKGLNYTKANGSSWPTGTSSNTYNNSTLAKVYIAYKGSEINANSTTVGYVSLDEQYSDIIYYKYYPIVNGYVTIPLIDNPYADRPNNRAFNGWVTDYVGAEVSLDVDTYTRYVKVPAASEINITMYASWTEATVTSSPTSSSLKSVGMVRVAPSRTPVYVTPTLYSRGSITSGNGNNGNPYPNGVYDINGNSLNGQRCRRINNQNTRCYYYSLVDLSTISQGQNYYQLLNGTMTAYTVPAPDHYNIDSFMNVGDSLAGYFKIRNITGGASRAGLYNSSGVIQTGNGNGTYYELVQDPSVVLTEDNYDQYYYFVTRDTNIAFLDSNTAGFTTSRPVTITGINNGSYESGCNVTISRTQITAGADLRIEYCGIRSSTLSNSTSSPADSTTNLIVGNYYNLKVGRGIRSYESGNSRYKTANAVICGNHSATGSSSSPTKYNCIVESGYYNSISGTGTTGSSTYNSETRGTSIYVNGVATYGSDIDRIDEENDNLEVYYNIAGTVGGLVFSNGTNSTPFLTQIVKSGTIGEASTNSASGIYVGGLSGGHIYAPAEIIVEGGKIFNINGGPLISDDLTSYNAIYINLKGGSVDNIFGGAAQTETYGNRIISVTGGMVRGSVFGGSNGYDGSEGDGTVDGNTFIYAGGSVEIGDTTLEGDNPGWWGAEAGSIFGAGNGRAPSETTNWWGEVTGVTYYNNIGAVNNSRVIVDSGAKVNGNVYGGANYGILNAKSGTAVIDIDIYGGTVSGSIYGGGNNNGVGSTSRGANPNITVTGGNVGNVYGGSRTRGRVYGNTELNILGGTIGNVYGGGEGGYDDATNYGTYVSGSTTVNIGNVTGSPTINGSVYGGSAFGTVNGTTENGSATNSYSVAVNVRNGTIVGNVFGGGQGDSDHTPKVYGNVTVTIDGGNISNVFGGNDLAGRPSNTDTVILNGGTIGNVYGGGNKTGQNTTSVFLQGSTLTGDLFGGSNENGTVTTTNVTITSGSVRDVYGGNNLGGYATTTNVTINGSAVNRSVYGGGNQAGSGTTNVTVTSGTVPSVFGGGNQAGVATMANVTINNGDIGNVYGGSNESGAVEVTTIIMKNGEVDTIYGGNNLGGTIKNTNVTVQAGTVTDAVYGGGNRVGVTEATHVNVTGGNVEAVYGGSNVTGDVVASYVTIGGSNSLEITDVYGGNNLGGKVTTTNVTVTSSDIENLYGGGNQAPVGSTNLHIGNGTIQNLYGGGNAAEVTGNTFLAVNDANIPTNLYGGGNQGAVFGNTEVYVTDTTVGGSIYAGGNGASATVHGNTLINIDGNTVVGSSTTVTPNGSVFGGGNAATTGVEGTNTSTATVNIVGGEIYGNVYGGANTSIVYGRTFVNIGSSAVESYLEKMEAEFEEEHENDPNAVFVPPFDISVLEESNLKIHGTVFGGGESNASGSDHFDWNFISVTDSIDIVIDGTDYAVNHHDFILEGSIFGSGNASTSRGDSSIYIKKLGSYSNVSRNISIQRTDTLTIDNCWMELSGIEDSTNDYADIKYTFNQVNLLVLKNNSTLLLKKNANLLKELYSGVDVNGELVPAEVRINTNGQVTSQNVDNRIYMIPDNNLNVTTNQAATTYGKITGMTFFGMYTSNAGGSLRYGMYDKNYHDGDPTDASDLVLGGSYVLGLHLVNHDITTNGFYSNYMNDDYTEIETDYVMPSDVGENGYRWIIGQYSISYNFSLTASKYSSLGTYELSMYDFSKGDTKFKVLGFNAEGLAPEVELLDPLNVPKLTETEEEANRKLGLAMKSETHEWTDYQTTKYLSANGGTAIGDKNYRTDSQALSPSLMFYFYHAKNISLDQELGTVVVSLEAAEPLNAIEDKISLVTITIDLYAKEYDDGDSYDASISYGKKYEMPTANVVNITNQSQFSTYFSLFANANDIEDIYGINHAYYHALVTDYVLPVGTQITMIDYGVNDVNPDFYYFTVDQANYNSKVAQLAVDNEVTYELSEFIRMGSTSTNNKYNDTAANVLYYDTDHNRTIEEFMFIFDFKETTQSGTHEDNSILFELRNSEDRSILTVLGIRQNLMDYNLYDSGNTVLLGILNDFDGYLYQNRPNTFNYVTSVGYEENENRSSIIDTNYESSPMGINVSLIDSSGEQVSSSLLTGTTVKINNHYYFADSDGVWRINLAGKVSNLNRNVELLTDNNLHSGNYTLRVTLFASSDGTHNSNPERSHTVEVPLVVVGDENAIKVTSDDKTKVVNGETSLNEDKSDTNEYTVRIMSVLADPNLRVTVYKRNTDTDSTTEFTQVAFSSLFKDTYTGTANEKVLATNPDSEETYEFELASSLTSGTYRVIFELYDGDYLVDSDFEYVIVTKPINEN